MDNKDNSNPLFDYLNYLFDQMEQEENEAAAEDEVLVTQERAEYIVHFLSIVLPRISRMVETGDRDYTFLVTAGMGVSVNIMKNFVPLILLPNMERIAGLLAFMFALGYMFNEMDGLNGFKGTS